MSTDVQLADAEVLQRRRLRRAMFGIGAAVLAVIALAIMLWPEPALVPQLSAAKVTQIELELTTTSGGQVDHKKTYEDRASIEALMVVLNTAREIADHRCVDTGHIVARLRDGSEQHYGLLSGHDELYYHVRRYDGLNYRIYRVDRPTFLAIMQKLGVKRMDEVRPEL